MQDIKKKKGIIPSHPEKKEKRKAAAYVSEKKWKNPSENIRWVNNE